MNDSRLMRRSLPDLTEFRILCHSLFHNANFQRSATDIQFKSCFAEGYHGRCRCHTPIRRWFDSALYHFEIGLIDHEILFIILSDHFNDAFRYPLTIGAIQDIRMISRMNSAARRLL
jgi:hypothetical protein